MDRERIRAVVVAALRRSGLNPYRAAIDAGLPADAIRHLIAGHEPKAGRLAQVCAALGLEFYVGPPRRDANVSDINSLPHTSLRALEASAQTLNRIVTETGHNPVPDDLWPVLAARRRLEPQEPGTEYDLPTTATRPIAVVQLAAIAGGGPDSANQDVTGSVWFSREWLEGQGLEPRRCAVIEVSGPSMEPTLPDGCSILVDLGCTVWQLDHIYVVCTDDALIVRRAGSAEDGSRLLLSDNAESAPAPWPDGAELMGEARLVICPLP